MKMFCFPTPVFCSEEKINWVWILAELILLEISHNAKAKFIACAYSL